MAERIRCDVAVLGTGPAGLQAAIHAARRKAAVLVLGRIVKSSAYQAHIENYCCIDGTTGEALLEEGRRQAERMGARFRDEDALSIRETHPGFEITTEGGSTVSCKAVVLAMGISRKALKVPGEKEFLGRGVSYCVECDANFFKDRAVAVVGCESAAVSGALTLLFYAREVHLVCRELLVAENLAERLRESAVVLHEGRWVEAIEGTTEVESLLLDDGNRLPVEGVFIELGAKGAIELAAGLGVALDPETMQYVSVNRKQETNVAGIYAAGDICGPPWQIAKAVGEGCVAGLEAAAYARELAKGAS